MNVLARMCDGQTINCFIRIRVDRRSIVNMRLGCRWSGSEPHEVGDLLI